MMPIEPLMMEHRLIARMIRGMQANLPIIRDEGKVDTAFVDGTVDFIKIYADRCQHGQEEDLLFRGLAKKRHFS